MIHTTKSPESKVDHTVPAILHTLHQFLKLFTNFQVLIDGPSIERQAISLGKVVLTPLVLEKLPRGSRTATVHKKWAAADIDSKWAATAWAKKLAARKARANLSDFERFQVMVLRKQRRYAVKKIAAKA